MKKWFTLGLLSLLSFGSTWAVDNPLPVVLDGSVVCHNGVYFGMADSTNAAVLVSGNLMDWTPVAPVLAPAVAGPYELLSRNGLFSLYVQNRVHAAADRPVGPYSNLRRMDFSGEDLRLFQDAAGPLLSVYRIPGSKKEGEIWMQRFDAPWKPASHPWQLLDGRRGMWDSTESADLGEPEMFAYRGNYYLLYASNRASPRTGLREVGVAVNPNPKRFGNIDKLADPALMRNTERLTRTYAAILPSGEYAKWKGSYFLKPPEEGWTRPGFDAKGWRTGEGGFGFPFEDGDEKIHAARTKWTTDQLWIRRTFRLDGKEPETPVLNLRHECAVQVFLNGKRVYDSSEPLLAYGNFDLSTVAAGAFRDTDNVLAVHAVADRESEFRFLDVGLFDAGTHPVEPVVCNPDAPRMVEGPNGFEKWLAYRAWWNGGPGTGLDRVFFYGSELVVDGPTTVNTPGYHPPPARPTFSDGFSAGDSALQERWAFAGGEWTVTNGTLHQASSREPARAFLRQKPARNYLFETHIRFPKGGKGAAGVVAYNDGKRELVVSIDPAKNSWSYRIAPGSTMSRKAKLPKGFRLVPGALHRLRIVKNAGHFDVMFDHFRLTADKPITTTFTGAGVPGLFCSATSAGFDGVAYTVGWDEHGERITGWGSAADGSPAGGEWYQDNEDGLEQKRHSEPGRAFKGDLLDQYEFTVNLRTEKLEEGKERLYGVFPVFIDQQNYLKAMIDTRRRELVVSGKRRGKPIGPYAKSLKRRIPHRHLYDKATSDREVAAGLYALRSPSIITALDVRWLEGKYGRLQQEFSLPVDEMLIRYADLRDKRAPILWDDGRFCEADEPRPLAQEPGILNPLSIRPETGNHIGFAVVVSDEIDAESDPGKRLRPYYSSRPQETLVTVEVESSYFFRCVKLKDRVVIELNGQPMLVVEGAWPASQVGLLTEGQPCFFDGIMLMHLPKE